MQILKSHLSIFLLILTITLNAQGRATKDSLYQIWRQSKVDTMRLKAANNLGWRYLYSLPDSALYFAQEQIKLSKKINNNEFISSAYNLLGGVEYIKGNNISAIEYYELSRDYGIKGKNKMALASVLNNLGLIYSNEGLYSKALDCFQQSLSEYILQKAKFNIVKARVNIGTVYENTRDNSSALTEYKRANAEAKILNDPQLLAMTHGSLGNIYSATGDFESAKFQFDTALVYSKKSDDKRNMSALLNNLGNMLNFRKKYNEALVYFNEALSITETLGDQRGLAHILFNVGECLIGLNKIDDGIEHCKRGLIISKQSNTVAEMQGNCSCLYKAYKLKGDYSKALSYFEQAKVYEDSLQNMELKRTVTRQSVAFEFNKKIAADSIRNLEEQKIKDLQIAGKEAELQKEEQQRVFLWIGVILALVFGAFMYNRFRYIRNQNKIIEAQKKLVEQKQGEILDSIHYAKRIQTALVSSEYYINKSLRKLKDK